MAFRADEEALKGYQNAVRYLISREFDREQSIRSKDLLDDIILKHGPVVDSYPSWHPLVSQLKDPRCPITTPSERCGYKGLDHTIYLANGFITCPYHGAEEVIDCIENFNYSEIATIRAERLEEPLYNKSTEPVLVYCEWNKPILNSGMIPKSVAVPLMLEDEVPCWRWSQYGETWETMRPYLLGQPNGSRSSLFIDQEAGQAMKTIWNTLIKTGMFGPIKV